MGLRLWFPEFQNSTKIYEVDDADHKMHGYGITELVDPSLGTKEGYVFGTHRLWSIVIPLETETITVVVATDSMATAANCFPMPYLAN